jgi:hypothetical protein
MVHWKDKEPSNVALPQKNPSTRLTFAVNPQQYHTPTKQLSWRSTNIPSSSFTFPSTITQPLQHSTREQQSPYPKQYLPTHATSLEPQRQPKLAAQFFNCIPSPEFNERKSFRDKIQLNNINTSKLHWLAQRRSKRCMKSNELRSEKERQRIALYHHKMP